MRLRLRSLVQGRGSLPVPGEKELRKAPELRGKCALVQVVRRKPIGAGAGPSNRTCLSAMRGPLSVVVPCC